MLDLASLHTLTDQIAYRNWTLRCGEDESALWLQWTFSAPNNYTGQTEIQHGRKWRVSRHATDGEVVQTAFLAVLVAVEHEAREEFTYQGEMLFNTHIDLDAMIEAAKTIKMRA